MASAIRVPAMLLLVSMARIEVRCTALLLGCRLCLGGDILAVDGDLDTGEVHLSRPRHRHQETHGSVRRQRVVDGGLVRGVVGC